MAKVMIEIEECDLRDILMVCDVVNDMLGESEVSEEALAEITFALPFPRPGETVTDAQKLTDDLVRHALSTYKLVKGKVEAK